MTRRILLIAAAVSLSGAAGAQAHARLERAMPRVGETVRASPRELRLWFSESLQPDLSSVILVGPGGRVVATGQLAIEPKDRRQIVVPIAAPLAPGAYRVDWRATSRDTHRTDGDYRFNVAPNLAP